MYIHCVKLAGKNKLTPNNCYVFSGSIDFSGKKMDFGNLDFGIEIRCRRGGGVVFAGQFRMSYTPGSLENLSGLVDFAHISSIALLCFFLNLYFAGNEIDFDYVALGMEKVSIVGRSRV